ncbi:MAG: flagellar M-ring protein FliF [Actinobacteria bacterium]|nr:flagellar M-ring protein FliF [Actinomycetota bacterium]
MQRLLEQLRRMASRYTAGQKAAAVLIAALLGAGIYLLVGYASKPQYRVLFSGLEDRDSAQVVAKLDEMKVGYRLEGTSVLVPAGEVDRLRVQLAAENIPSGGKVGFEIFDKSSFGASDFTQKVNYQRALEGELSRTISSIDQVQSAVVHIAMPEESIFTSQENSATASVLISLRGGASLEKRQVEGIRNLVARAVEGLSPENVSVVDSEGNPLFAGDDGAALAADRLQTTRSYESYMEASLQQILNRVVGSGKGVVKVSLELDLATRTTQTEKYAAPAEGGLPSSQETSEEIYNNGAGSATGVPGTGSNIPDYTTVTPGAGNAAYSKKESSVTYDNNRTVTEETEPPGKITGMSIAVLVDESVDADSVYALQEALAAAAGLDERRGDTISVQSVPFDTSYQEEVEAQLAKAQSGERLWKMVKTGLLALAALAAAVFLFLKLKKVRKRLEELPELEARDTLALEEAAEGARALMGRTAKSPMLSSLEMLAAQKPDEMARLLKALIHERS